MRWEAKTMIGLIGVMCMIILTAMHAIFLFCPKTIITPDPAVWPCITGKGYEAIIGWAGKERTFLNGIEYDVIPMQEKLGCEKLDGVVGGETSKAMRDFNGLAEYY